MKVNKGKRDIRIGEKKKKRNLEQNVKDVETYVTVNNDGIYEFFAIMFFFHVAQFLKLLPVSSVQCECCIIASYFVELFLK